MENCCESIVKYLIFIVNFIFAVTGLLLIGFGVYVYVYTQANSYPELEGEDLFKAAFFIPILLITIGVFILVIFFIGCCGSLLESRCMLLTYAVLLTAILLVEVFFAISAYVRLPGIIQDMKTEMINDRDKGAMDFWDDLQQNLTCCGVMSYKDWKNNHSTTTILPTSKSTDLYFSTILPPYNSSDLYFSPSSLTDDAYIPKSCCDKPPCTEKKAYQVGCFEQVEGVLTVGANVAIGIWLFQLIIVICSCWIGLRSKKAENGEFLFPRSMRN